MSFVNVWPFAFLLLIPAIIILYLLKQKSVDYSVASLYLWKEAFKNNTATTPFQKFRNNLLMYVQIITVLALIIALASPFIKNFGDEKQDTIIIIDTSASMQRMYDDKNTRLEEAKEAASDYIRNLMNNSCVTVVTVDNMAKVNISNSEDKGMALEAVDSIEQTDLEGNMESAISLVYALTNGNEEIQVVAFSDDVAAFVSEGINVVNMQNVNEDNAFVSLVSHVESEKGLSVLVTVNNNGAKDITTDINLYGDDNLLAVETADIEAGKSANVIFENIDFSGSILTADINKKDSLLRDNKFYHRVEEEINSKTLLVTGQNVFLEKALITCGNIELYKATSADNILENDEYELYVFDGVVPEKLPKKGNILFFNCSHDEIVKATKSSAGGIITIKPSMYTEYLDNYSFGVNEFLSYEVPTWGEVIMSHGDSNVAFAGEYDGRCIAAIGFDLHNSQFPLEAEFPILVSQLLDVMLEADLVRETDIVAGEAININGKIDGENIVIKDSDKSKLAEFEPGNAYFSDNSRTGVYVVNQKNDDGKLEDKYAVNFPISESVDGENLGDDSGVLMSVGDIKGDFNLSPYVIFTCIFLLMIEWIIYLKKL